MTQLNNRPDVSVYDIRTANQIFAEHKSFTEIIKEQKILISQKDTAFDEMKSKFLLSEEARKKTEDIVKAKDQLIENEKHNTKVLVKSAKKQAVIAYIVAGASLVVTGLVLAK